MGCEGGTWIAILKKVCRRGVIEKMRFVEQRFKGGREVSYMEIWEGIFLAEEKASANVLRREHTWYGWGLHRGQCGPRRESERKEEEVGEASECNDCGFTLRGLSRNEMI